MSFWGQVSLVSVRWVSMGPVLWNLVPSSYPEGAVMVKFCVTFAGWGVPRHRVKHYFRVCLWVCFPRRLVVSVDSGKQVALLRVGGLHAVPRGSVQNRTKWRFNLLAWLREPGHQPSPPLGLRLRPSALLVQGPSDLDWTTPPGFLSLQWAEGRLHNHMSQSLRMNLFIQASYWFCLPGLMQGSPAKVAEFSDVACLRAGQKMKGPWPSGSWKAGRIAVLPPWGASVFASRWIVTISRQALWGLNLGVIRSPLGKCLCFTDEHAEVRTRAAGPATLCAQGQAYLPLCSPGPLPEVSAAESMCSTYRPPASHQTSTDPCGSWRGTVLNENI